MRSQPLAVLGTGLVTAVGLSAPAACAAIRAKVSNPSETRFMDEQGEWIMGCEVQLDRPWRGAVKLARMAALAIAECLGESQTQAAGQSQGGSLESVPRDEWKNIPLCVCVAEADRPGRIDALDETIHAGIEAELQASFSRQSVIVPRGRAGIGVALDHARKLIYQDGVPRVLIAATDGLLTWPQLRALEQAGRLLTPANSNGFIPGEAAGAILVGRPERNAQLLCRGIGFGTERATIHSDEPLRADGLVQAFNAALAEAGCALHELDFRITDLSGEQYYFKEAALAVSRVMRQRKEEFDLWHAAECTGEVGAAAGVVALVVADAACRKAYAPGSNILVHAGNDSGERTALVLGFGAT